MSVRLVDQISFGSGVAFVAVGAAIVKGIARLWQASRADLYQSYVVAKNRRIVAECAVGGLGLFALPSTRSQVKRAFREARKAESVARDLVKGQVMVNIATVLSGKRFEEFMAQEKARGATYTEYCKYRLNYEMTQQALDEFYQLNWEDRRGVLREGGRQIKGIECEEEGRAQLDHALRWVGTKAQKRAQAEVDRVEGDLSHLKTGLPANYGYPALC